jgi:hypothetical protein
MQMKAYVRHLLALFAAVFGSQASVPNQAGAQSPAESQAWASAKADGTRQAFEAYLSEYPIGDHAREAFTRIIQLTSDLGYTGEIEEFSDGDVFSIQSSGSGGGGLAALY